VEADIADADIADADIADADIRGRNQVFQKKPGFRRG